MTKEPKVKDFSAWINLMPGSPSKLIVVGKVETSAGNKLPKLTRAVPQGLNDKQLILDLTIYDTGGIGTQDVAFRDVRYEESALQGQFTEVLIRWNDKDMMTLKVTEAR